MRSFRLLRTASSRFLVLGAIAPLALGFFAGTAAAQQPLNAHGGSSILNAHSGSAVLNAAGGSAILNGGSLSGHSLTAVSTMAGGFVGVSPRITSPASSWSAPAVTTGIAVSPASTITGTGFSASSISGLNVRSIAVGGGAASAINGISAVGTSSIAGSRIGAFSYGAGSSSSITGVSLGAPSAIGNSISARAYGAGATAHISGVSISGGNSLSGNSISAFACGNCR